MQTISIETDGGENFLSYNDVLLTCDFCRKRKKFAKMDQVCLRPLTAEEIEEFKQKGKIPLKMEFAMRCDRCKECGISKTVDGYSIEKVEIEVASKEEMADLIAEKELNRYKASLFKRRRK
jgi:Na+-translocating ferredoxin:NAD+ oxidoreductase RnfC subunit